jgi:hypothetical protein
MSVEQIEKIAIAAAATAAAQAIESAATAAAERAAKRAAERVAMSSAEIHAIVSEAVRETLMQLGVDTSDPLAMQRDFQHLRQWREAGEDLRRKGIVVVAGIFLSGLASLIILGVRAWIKNP